ncbi:MAG: DUF4097 domain-containing protein [Acidobacteriota bacterium]|nr:DUF4097 domain-containing protein [Acidobacteriota bacterium]
MSFRTNLVVLVLMLSPVLALANGDKRDDKGRGSKVERTVAADSHVTVSACSVSGAIIVHGWERNEVRVRSTEAAEIKFQRKDPGVEASPVRKIELLILDKEQGPTQPGFCESSSEIELDVPRGATVQLRTRDSDISVFEVATAYVNTQNGDVMIEHATTQVEAGSISGGISLKDSSGRINLHSAGGSIEASDVRPAEAGDTFEARSLGGEITLDNVTHTQLSAHTLNGSLSVTGPLARSGRYNFRTMSGDITLTMPEDSSFQVSARFSQRAEIITDFPLTLIPLPSAPAIPAVAPAAVVPASPPAGMAPQSDSAHEKDSPEIIAKVKTKKGTMVIDVASVTLRRLEGIHGTGDAKLELASFSGTIHLQKQ